MDYRRATINVVNGSSGFSMETGDKEVIKKVIDMIIEAERGGEKLKPGTKEWNDAYSKINK